jgi:transposase
MVKADLNEARALLAKGMSMPKTARKLGVGTSTLYRLLQAERTVREAANGAFSKGLVTTSAVQVPEVSEITKGTAA